LLRHVYHLQHCTSAYDSEHNAIFQSHLHLSGTHALSGDR
jgi:hypothetical protein